MLDKKTRPPKEEKLTDKTVVGKKDNGEKIKWEDIKNAAINPEFQKSK